MDSKTHPHTWDISYSFLIALQQREKGIVRLLLERGADINKVWRGYGTALTLAAFGWGTDIISLLLEQGADVNTVGGEYGTALVAAAVVGRIDIMSLLLERGADVNTVGGEYGTALGVAAFNGRMDIVSLLLERGADVNTVGGEYGTALAAAALRGRMDIMSLLLERGADVNTVGGEYGTALGVAALRGRMDIMSLLLERGADVNTVGGKYGTALVAAAVVGSIDIMSLLLDRGADVDAVGGEYATALVAAAFSGRIDIMLLLLGRGADIMCLGGQHVNGKISWPPFPMPYTGAYHHNITPSSIILPTTFCAGGNLTPEQADLPCSNLLEEALSNSLAALVGLEDTTLTLTKRQWIRYDVCYFVAHNFDFGLAYAAARVAWKHFKSESMTTSYDIIAQRSRWHKNIQVLEDAQSKVIEIDSNHSSSVQVQQELILSPYSIMPRRLWDLKSNRVVDFRMLQAAQLKLETRPAFWAVTHSWTSNMSLVWTAINQFQWPVPLPKGISLEYLQSELLSLGAEYVWLDVICLRQKKSEIDSLEQLRQQEWKIDVPTIGNIYRAATKIVRYFNGLGVPFSNDGWDGPRHWLRRAWTLQEIASENTTINAGIPQDQSQRRVFLNSQGMFCGKTIKFRSAIDPVIQLAAQVDSEYGCEIYELAQEMDKRHSTEQLDKLSGLFYLLRTTKLPCYDEHKTSEDIWRQCFHLLPLERKAEVLFNFPYRGSDEQWPPTWAQVLDWPTRDPEYHHVRLYISKDLLENTLGEISVLIRDIWTIPDITLCKTNYTGEYDVKINGRLFGFYLPYLQQNPIDIEDPPVYTLATVRIGHAHNWILCKAIEKRVGENVGPDGASEEVSVLKKVSVMRTDSCSELLVGGHNGVSVLQQMDCLFV